MGDDDQGVAVAQPEPDGTGDDDWPVPPDVDPVGQVDQTGMRHDRGLGLILGQALEQQRADDGPAEWARHARPLDGRAGVQHETAALELGNQLAGAPHVHEHRLGREDLVQGGPVRLFSFF